ncbi:MAG: hypothetical protein DI529_15620 [Chryseobacterium sp.]|nr:MAG: hypothetical protein DI529_15620 [Chryseobacterium sp.]
MISQLTFTRFIAAFLIVFLHYGENLLTNTSESFFILRNQFHLGVSYFFVLSGFVMMIAYSKLEKIGFKDYMINRVSRIYPTHILALVLTVLFSLLSSINYLSDYSFDLKCFSLVFLLLQAWFSEYALSFNIPSWSLSAEMFFYACFPFMFNRLFKKQSPKIIIITCISFWAISQIGLNIYHSSDYFDPKNVLDKNFLCYKPIFNLSSFVIGCLFGYLFKLKNRVSKNYDLAIVLLIVLTTVFVIKFNYLLLQNGLLAINFGLLIFLLANNNGKITSIFKHKKLVHLGDISFAMYILQYPVFMALKKVNYTLKLIDNPYIYFTAGFLILLIASHFVYVYFEDPMRKKIKNIFV